MNAAERLDTELATTGTAGTLVARPAPVRRGILVAFLHWLLTGHDPHLLL